MRDPEYSDHITSIADWMTRYYQKNNPDKRRSKQDYEAIAERYLQACRKIIFTNAGKTFKDKNAPYTLKITQTKLTALVPDRVIIDGQQQFWAYILRDKFPMWKVDVKGYPGQTSSVDINHTPIWRSIVNNTISERILDDPEIQEKFIEEIDKSEWRNRNSETQMDNIPIDMINLDNALSVFLRYYNEAYLENNTARMTKVIRMIAQGRNIHNATRIMSENYDHDVLPHFPKTKNYRKYYTGDFNLLSCLKEVRHAALGKCHEYDLRCSVFSYYADYCHRNSLESTHIRAYVANTEQVRDLLAKTIQPYVDKPTEDCVKIIKTYITALGFGASSQNGYVDSQNRVQGALPDILHDPEARQALHDTDIICGIISEIKGILADVTLKTSPESKLRWVQKHKDKANFSARSKLSELYFEHEQIVMFAIKQYLAEKHPNHKILLQVHDCIYVSHTIDVKSLCDMLRLDDINPFMKISHTQIDRYANLDLHELDQTAHTEHLQRIGQEQALAMNYHSSMIDTETANKPRPVFDTFVTSADLAQGQQLAELCATNPEIMTDIQSDPKLLANLQAYKREQANILLKNIEFSQEHGEFVS